MGKNVKIVVGVAVLLVLLLLNVHIIRFEGDVDIIAKDHMSFRDTFVNAEGWGVNDFFAHSPRVRDHLLWNRKYPQLARDLETAVDIVKGRLFTLEGKFHEWLSEKLE